MQEQRVVITGLGVVSGVGFGARDFALAIRRGDCAATDTTVFDTTGFNSHKGCEVKGFVPERWVQRLEPARLGRSSLFSIAATRMALEDAGIVESYIRDARCGVSLGTTDGESQLIDQLVAQWVTGGFASCNPQMLEQFTADNISRNVAREFGVRNGAVTIPTACAAGNYAIGYAYDRISVGDVDIMICGGADSMCRKTFAGFYRLGTIAPERCQPFDKDRQGLLTGEGAGILLLESLDSARRRNAKVYAEVLGYAMNCDAQHMVAPNKSRIAACMRQAHRNAGVESRQIDWISAHGTGTLANDVTESGAIWEVFGDKPPPTTSIKSMIGHSMGAASALASVACAIALDEGFIPPTINCNTPDPACALDCVPNVAREAKLSVVQNNGFAFGGNNCITIYGTPNA